MARTISFVKGKGSLRHNNREFIANNVDRSRISWNVTYVCQPLKDAYDEIFGRAVEEYNEKQKRKDRRIDDYLKKIKNSGNKEKQFYEIVVQIGKKDDTGVLDDAGNLSETATATKEILDEYAKSFQERNPNLILFNAVLHMDEATPHLHLDYIPVAHGYKTGLETRNSLTKGLQEMGIAPASGKTDNETMHWQERERDYLTELCQGRDMEIEILGADRDNYSIPEYKKAMREKEAAEAEMEILNAEKTEVEAALSEMDQELESGKKEIEEQKELLSDINEQISEAEKKIANKEKALDKILSAGEPVEKEIKDIRSKASEVTAFFGGEQMVKMPKTIFEKMISKYRVARSFENLNAQYSKELCKKERDIIKLTEQNGFLKDMLKKCTDFVTQHGLVEAFKEFLRPKTVLEKLEINKKKSESLEKHDKHRENILENGMTI